MIQETAAPDLSWADGYICVNMSGMGRVNLLWFTALALLLAVGGLCCAPIALSYEGEFNPAKEGILPVNYVSFWTLKPDGYHPSILLKLENDTGRNLTGERLRFQAIIVNLRNGEVTRGRTEVRKSFGPKGRIYVTLVGSDPYELPISTSDWPSMECKVLARVGDTGDEATQTLAVTDVERVAMTDEEAKEAVEKMREFSQASAEELARQLPAKPLKAAPPGVLHPPRALVKKTPPPAKVATATPAPKLAAATPVAAATGKAITRYLQAANTPGLGDDFLAFEQKFGLPIDTEKASGGWTWASYRHANPEVIVYAGASSRKGQADLLIVQIPAKDAAESDLMEIARMMSGKSRTQKLSTPQHTVRYLSVGRTELVTAKAQSYQVSYYTPHSQSHHYTIILSRVPGEMEALLSEHTQRANMLKSMAALFEP
jgi:hypothetical protein